MKLFGYTIIKTEQLEYLKSELQGHRTECYDVTCRLDECRRKNETLNNNCLALEYKCDELEKKLAARAKRAAKNTAK